ncbi:MAG: hypothetical protein JW936_02830 [Sedimentisphaerales bacterium]|nr:hypothetical protein [Sedimentisphaerales bacterium]
MTHSHLNSHHLRKPNHHLIILAILIALLIFALAGCDMFQQSPYPRQIDASQQPPYGTTGSAQPAQPNNQTQPNPYLAPSPQTNPYLNSPDTTQVANPNNYNPQQPTQQPYPNQPQYAAQNPYPNQQPYTTAPQNPNYQSPTPRVTGVSVIAATPAQPVTTTTPPPPMPASVNPTYHQPSQSTANSQPDFSAHLTNVSVPAQPNQTPTIIVQQPAAQPDPADSVEQTITTLERLIADDPENYTAQLALQLLHATYSQEENTNTEIPNLTPEQQARAQQVADAMMLAVRAAGQQGQSNPELANQALQALQQLTSQVAQNADLNIAKVELCSRVDGFGRYEVIPQTTLASGQPQRVLVYCELQNFQSQIDAQGRYLTRLRATITFYNSNFDVLAQRADDVTDIPSFNQRHDFFLRGALDLPALAPGQYQVVVRIEDLTAQKIADARVEFEVNPTATQP